MTPFPQIRKMYEVCTGSSASLPTRFAHYIFFFSSRRRHTRCLSDWSSDVCSSDLPWTRSLLCYPVKIRNRVRWILNVEDNSPRAFAKEEIGSLRRLFETASVALNALAERHVLRAVVEESSQGVIIINDEGIVTGMNPEAR